MDQIAQPPGVISQEKLDSLRDRYEGKVFTFSHPDGELGEGTFEDIYQQCPHFQVLGAGAIKGTFEGMIEDGSFRKMTSEELAEQQAKKKQSHSKSKVAEILSR